MVGESAQNFVHYYSIKPSTSIWCLTSLKTYGRLRCEILYSLQRKEKKWSVRK